MVSISARWTRKNLLDIEHTASLQWTLDAELSVLFEQRIVSNW